MPKKLAESDNREEGTARSPPKDQLGSPSVQELSRALTECRIIRTQQIPTPGAPEKFHLNGNYNRWESQVRRYLRWFAEERQEDIVMGLLDGEAYDIVNEADVFNSGDLDSAFKQIRRLLDAPGHPSQYRQEFHGRGQRADEDVRSFGRVLKWLSQRAYPDETKEERERRVLEQLIDGVSNPAVKRTLLRGKFENLAQALSAGEAEERVERAVAGVPAGDECCVLREWQPRSQHPGRNHSNWRRSWYRGKHAGTRRLSYNKTPGFSVNRWGAGPHNSSPGTSYSQPVESSLPLFGTRTQARKQVGRINLVQTKGKLEEGEETTNLEDGATIQED